MNDPYAYYARCPECGKYVPDEMISLVLVNNVETEMCQECLAEARELGVMIEPVGYLER